MWIKRINILSLIAITTVMANIRACYAEGTVYWEWDNYGDQSTDWKFDDDHFSNVRWCYRTGNDYYFCGEYHKGDICNGNKYRPCCDNNHGYGHGAKKTMSNGKTYYCCNKNGAKHWRRIDGDKSWIHKVEIRQESTTNADGSVTKCTYKDIYTVCSGPNTIDKTEKSCFDCPAATPYYRNQTCVEFCGATDATMAFSSLGSNECAACETNDFQGIRQLDQYGCDENQTYDTTTGKCKAGTNDQVLYNVCVKCDPATQFFDATKKVCVNKNSDDLIKKSKVELKQCWLALSPRVYECCLKHGSDQLDAYLKLSRDEQQDDEAINELECCVNGGSWTDDACSPATQDTTNTSTGSDIAQIIQDVKQGAQAAQAALAAQ